ncbi:uncharacterized protein LOC111381339 isoform X1 [Olea europaea var. sylvestris]|uniref:uncharacterized protein LOC111381339 isoform X1 n=1 Tax=Olea europaea var. sylvestris TaxID=158386 RepID=UPI000C1CFB3E|nr:uncharacterized protein LOC111381339 isoform X1 [Olea europaea var. sylvestris]
MDHILMREVVIDIESDVNMSRETRSPDLLDAKLGKISSDKVGSAAVNLDGPVRGGNGASLSRNVKNLSDVSLVLEKNVRKEKRKSNSAKKPPKPPRPPRGLSLDAPDQKLIKEIAELAMIKRARIERIKALKKMKRAKHSSMSSSTGNLIAILFTLLFCIVIILQGMSPGNNAAAGFHGSPETNVGPESGFIVVHDHQNIL